MNFDLQIDVSAGKIGVLSKQINDFLIDYIYLFYL